MSKGNKPPKNDKAKMKPKKTESEKKPKRSTGMSGLFTAKEPQ